MRPVRWSRITQPFADPGSYASNADGHGPAGHHTGIDFGAAWPRAIFGLTVRSPVSGEILRSAYDSTLGNFVEVYNAADNVTIGFWHLASRAVSVGQSVSQGTPLGKVGNSGNSTAPHLHVQANRGRGFNYHAHTHPAPWVLGYAWWEDFKANLRRKRRQAAKRR